MSETMQRPGRGAAAEASRFALAPFSEWERQGQVRLAEATAQVTVSRDLFTAMLRPWLLRVRFDEAYYRRSNPDLVQAEATGIIKSMREHYLQFGYFESRLPCLVEVDAAFYSKDYPDVPAAIIDGAVKSAQYHFEMYGFKEGRLPRRGWSFNELVTGN